MTAEENKALVRRVFEEQSGQSLHFVDEVLVPNYVHHDPSLPPDMQRGRDNYRNGTAMFYSAFPDLTCTIEDQIAEGDKVVTRLGWKWVTCVGHNRCFTPPPCVAVVGRCRHLILRRRDGVHGRDLGVSVAYHPRQRGLELDSSRVLSPPASR